MDETIVLANPVDCATLRYNAAVIDISSSTTSLSINDLVNSCEQVAEEYTTDQERDPSQTHQAILFHIGGTISEHIAMAQLSTLLPAPPLLR